MVQMNISETHIYRYIIQVSRNLYFRDAMYYFILNGILNFFGQFLLKAYLLNISQ